MTPFKASPERSIASDCNSLVQEIIHPQGAVKRVTAKSIEQDEVTSIYKFKNSIWNKIISAKDFEQFNDKEYFKWIEIYKDSKNDFSNVNPVSIEQKMALIEVINGRLIAINIRHAEPLSQEIEKLSAYKLRKLQMRLRTLDLSSKLSRRDLESFSADFLLILKGPPTTLLDYFTKNKTVRMSERLTRMVQEDILRYGLKGMVDHIPEKSSYTYLEHGKYIIQRVFEHKAWRLFLLPYDLPWFNSVKIPDELLQKILMDGLDVHDQELIAHLKKQNMIDSYERFRKVYRPLAFSVGFYFYYDKFHKEEDKSVSEDQEREKKKFLDAFVTLADAIAQTNSDVVKSDATLKEEQFERVLEAFKEKYHEEPTPEEYKEMKEKIFAN